MLLKNNINTIVLQNTGVFPPCLRSLVSYSQTHNRIILVLSCPFRLLCVYKIHFILSLSAIPASSYLGKQFLSLFYRFVHLERSLTFRLLWSGSQDLMSSWCSLWMGLVNQAVEHRCTQSYLGIAARLIRYFLEVLIKFPFFYGRENSVGYMPYIFRRLINKSGCLIFLESYTAPS